MSRLSLWQDEGHHPQSGMTTLLTALVILTISIASWENRPGGILSVDTEADRSLQASAWDGTCPKFNTQRPSLPMQFWEDVRFCCCRISLTESNSPFSRKTCCHPFVPGDVFKYMSILIKLSNHLGLILPCLSLISLFPIPHISYTLISAPDDSAEQVRHLISICATGEITHHITRRYDIERLQHLPFRTVTPRSMVLQWCNPSIAGNGQ